jgi:hypothetical protein
MDERRGLRIVPLACASSSLVLVVSASATGREPLCAHAGVVLLRIISRLIILFGSFFLLLSTGSGVGDSRSTRSRFPTMLLILVRTLAILLDKLVIDDELVKENLEARLVDELDLGRFLSHCGRSLRGGLGAAVAVAVKRMAAEAGVGVVVRLGGIGVG